MISRGTYAERAIARQRDATQTQPASRRPGVPRDAFGRRDRPLMTTAPLLHRMPPTSFSFAHSGIEAEVLRLADLDPSEACVCRIEHVIAFCRDDDRRHGQHLRLSFDDPR